MLKAINIVDKEQRLRSHEMLECLYKKSFTEIKPNFFSIELNRKLVHGFSWIWKSKQSPMLLNH